MTNSTHFTTQSIHAGTTPDPTTGAIITPIYQTTTFVQQAVGQDKGFTYSRTGNPTVAALEARLGALEGGLAACCFATGMAATTALALAVLKAGDHVVLSDVVYGGTSRLFRQVLEKFGVHSHFVDTSNLAALATALQSPTRLLFLETPANPTLKLTDLTAACKLGKEAGAIVAVDNTFLTAALQKPFVHGADVVVYSTTKYIEGHNSTVGGALIVQDAKLHEDIVFIKGTAGCTQSPFDSWLTLRGIKTLSLRINQHSANALVVATFLESHPAVANVYYPGLPSFKQYQLACRQQASGGGMLSFDLHGGSQVAIDLMNALQLCALAENLGSVETLVTHPASMTHASVPEEERHRLGISEGLVRLSVGLEDATDIIADLTQALNVATAKEVR